FWINPPIVIVIALVMLAMWRDPPREQAVRIDVPGLLALVAGLGMIVFAVMQAPDWGWSNLLVWVLLAAGFVFAGLFVLVEKRRSQPLIDVDLFRSGAFTSFNLVIFLGQFSKINLFIFAAAYLQDVLGYAAMIAGVALLASTVPTVISAFPTGAAVDRVGSRVLVLTGLAVYAVASAWIAIAVTFESYLLLLPALVAWGICNPMLFAPSLRDVMNTVTPDKRGQAGGISMTAQLLGGTVGMTVCGTLYATTGLYWPIFGLVAVLSLGTFMLCWRTLPHFERTPGAQ
ncbi:MAG: MFS transporter, partial [Pseudomonadota bacterium]